MIGMLWYDKSAQAIENAIAHCEAKYGVRPQICYMCPSQYVDLVDTIQHRDVVAKTFPLTFLGQGHLTYYGVELELDRTIMRDCYWLVIGE